MNIISIFFYVVFQGPLLLFFFICLIVIRVFTAVEKLFGDTLNLTRVNRADMGAYLCIASNGVPPSVSKRIILDVECEYRTISLNNIIVLIKTYSERYTTPPKLLCTFNIINYILLSC